MNKLLSAPSRKELRVSFQKNYSDSSWLDRNKVIDGFVAATGYERKYAIKLLNTPVALEIKQRKSTKRVIYDEQVKQALVSLWHAANQICSKRLVPFIPELLKVLERHGHLQLPETVREKVLDISHSTVDRLLQSERSKVNRSVTTTKPGSLFKHRIKVRTFADWDDVIPGFIEADLVAHCGDDTNGSFLNTLTLIDISSGWLECMALIRKSANDVITALEVVSDLLPFKLLGLDTDNGSEFINNDLLDFCDDKNITFTRSRAYKKNDQAHVEEKNGSVVRRLVGYDRFEGQNAWECLASLYKVMRLYVNFFQPSLKLLSKERSGARVTKKYSLAKTPYQRLMSSTHIPTAVKDDLTSQYRVLDPINLLDQLQTLQDKLWVHAGSKVIHDSAIINDLKNKITGETDPENIPASTVKIENSVHRFYHKAEKIDLRKAPRTWRTRKDPFEGVWDEIRLRLELNPESSPKALLNWLIDKYPGEFKANHVRTLQRRISEWRNLQEGQGEKLRAIMLSEKTQESLTETLEEEIFVD